MGRGSRRARALDEGPQAFGQHDADEEQRPHVQGVAHDHPPRRQAGDDGRDQPDGARSEQHDALHGVV
jgi:hypothetical protein